MSCIACILLWIVFVIVSIGVAVKLYIKLTTRRNGCYTTLAGKTAIITGANTGIGYATALDFAMRGGRIILACRSREKAEEAQRKIIKETGNENVIVKVVDFQSLDSVRQFAKDINETERRLDILVNNAGAAFLGNNRTADGLQVTMQTNHFSAFLLTHLLIDKLKSSAPSRIVNVSSAAAKLFQRLDADNLDKYPEGGEFMAENTLYANTKLCNILFTIQLAKKLDGTGVTTNCLHPGAIKTEFLRSTTGFIKHISMTMRNLFFKTMEEGAQTTIYVSLSKDIAGVSGEMFDNCKQVEMYDCAKDAVLAKKVWEKSEEFVKLRSDEKL